MSSLKVLHIEDEEGQARLLRKRLLKAGYTVDWARDGVEGLAMFEGGSYDVVIVDYNMPRKSGFDVMKALVLRENAPPIVFLTASGDEKLAVDAMKHGASDYVVKDVTLGYLDLLPTVINSALYKKRLAEEKRLAEKELKKANERLEERVLDRTRELAMANARLEDEVAVRRRAEEENKRLATAMEQAADMVLITDSSGNIQYVNPAFERQTGYSRAELVGGNPRILKSGRQADAFYKNLWDTITAGGTWHGRLVNKKKDGTLYEEDMTISPVKDAGGTITNFVAVKHDVTAPAALARARDYFVAVTSHELRTPLNRLELAKTLLAESRKESSESTAMAKAINAVSEVSDSFERIISTSEIFRDLTLAGVEFQFIEADLGRILRESVESAAEKLESEKRIVAMDVNADKLAGARILCDPRLAQRAIDEILSNAVKYTPDGGTVRILGELADRHAIVEIADEGGGIDSDKKEMVFEPYFSPNDPLRHFTSQYKYMGGGLGMGLTLARLIMERSGGSLEMRSSAAGSAVILRFRMKQQD